MSIVNINNTFEFAGCICQLISHKYENTGRLAIQVVVADAQINMDNYHFPGNSIAWLSMNVDNVLIEKGEFVVKTYSENEGLFEAVLEAGLIVDTGKRIDVGFNPNQPIARLS